MWFLECSHQKTNHDNINERIINVTDKFTFCNTIIMPSYIIACMDSHAFM